MECLEALITRHSVRSFRQDAIAQHIIDDMLEAARHAPSCQNKQCWRFIIIDDPRRITGLSTHAGFIGTVNLFIRQAPLVVVACAEPSRSCVLNGQNYYLVDTAIAFQQMMLAAWHHGVGSCWLGAFNEKSVKNFLGIPEHIRVVGMSPFGYPADKASLYAKAVKAFAGSNNRLSTGEIHCRNSWSL
jgi:nitroreductase